MNASDADTTRRTAVVNEALARRCWPGQDPLGKRVVRAGGGPAESLEVVGVVGNLKHWRASTVFSERTAPNRQTARLTEWAIDQPPAPTVYVPCERHPDRGWGFMIRTRQAPAALAGPLRELARKTQPDAPPPLLYFMEQEFYAASQTQRTFMWFMDFFALTALVLSAIGLYAILSYSAAQRTKEIGIRMALGSAPRHVFMLVLGEGARVIALGAALGLAAALGLTPLLRAYLFEVSPTDPWALGGAVLLLSAVAFLACFLPARRATRLDPMNALRCE